MKTPKHLPKSVSLRVLIGIVLSSILITGSVLYYVWAATAPTSTFWITNGGVYPGAPSYTLWREGSNYFAKRNDGYLMAGTTNITDLTQDCIDTFSTSSGGRLFYQTANYQFDSYFSIPPATSILIEGEMGFDAVEFHGSGTHSIIRAVGTAGSRPVFTLQNIQFNGFATSKVAGQYLVYVEYSGGVWVENCQFTNGADDGIRFLNGEGAWIRGSSFFFNEGSGLNIVSCGGVYLTNSELYENDEYGLAISGSWNNRITGNRINQNGLDGVIMYDTKINEFTGNEMQLNTGDGLYLSGATEFNTFTGNTWRNNTAYAMDIDAGSVNNTFTGNAYYLEGATVLDNGAGKGNNTFRDNRGFVTQFCGNATISASTSVIISHGLYYTPDSVIVTMGTTGAGDYYVDTLTSKQFTVHVTNSGTYKVYWFAEWLP